VTSGRLGAPDWMEPQQRRKIYEAVAALPDRIGRRKSLIWGLGAPADHGRKGEELLLARMPQGCRRRMVIGAGHAEVLQQGVLGVMLPARDQGTLYVTDHRLALVGNRRRIQGEWQYADCSAVRVMPSCDGIQIVQGDAAVDADYVLRHVNPALTRPFNPDPPLKWPRQRVGTREYPSEQGEYVLSRVVFIRKERHSLDASFSQLPGHLRDV